MTPPTKLLIRWMDTIDSPELTYTRLSQSPTNALISEGAPRTLMTPNGRVQVSIWKNANGVYARLVDWKTGEFCWYKCTERTAALPRS